MKTARFLIANCFPSWAFQVALSVSSGGRYNKEKKESWIRL